MTAQGQSENKQRAPCFSRHRISRSGQKYKLACFISVSTLSFQVNNGPDRKFNHPPRNLAKTKEDSDFTPAARPPKVPALLWLCSPRVWCLAVVDIDCWEAGGGVTSMLSGVQGEGAGCRWAKSRPGLSTSASWNDQLHSLSPPCFSFSWFHSVLYSRHADIL